MDPGGLPPIGAQPPSSGGPELRTPPPPPGARTGGVGGGDAGGGAAGAAAPSPGRFNLHQYSMRTPIKSKAVEDLLFWENPKKSGAVLVAVILVYILLEWSHISLFRNLSFAMVAAVVGCLLWSSISGALGKPGPAELLPKVFHTGVDEPYLRPLLQQSIQPLNVMLDVVTRVVSGREIFLSIQVVAVFLIFGFIGRYLSALGLLFAVVLLAFTVPKLYEWKKHDLNEGLNTAYDHSNKVYRQAQEQIMKRTPKSSGVKRAE